MLMTIYGCECYSSRVFCFQFKQLTIFIHLQLTYRTFMPVQLTTGAMFTPAAYESQVDTMKRALAWCNATGGYKYNSHASSFTWNENESNLFII